MKFLLNEKSEPLFWKPSGNTVKDSNTASFFNNPDAQLPFNPSSQSLKNFSVSLLFG